jgi:hypothetical protein
MFETLHPDPPLATSRNLAAYHAHRERFYGMAAMLLAAAPDRAALSVLGRRTERSAVESALLTARGAAQSEFDRLFVGHPPRVELRCANPADGPRLDALERTGLPASVDIPAELRALAILADRTANAIECGDIAEAAAVSDLQARFLRQHAGACIRGLAAQLIEADQPFYAALGRALVTQIDEDVRLLAH